MTIYSHNEDGTILKDGEPMGPPEIVEGLRLLDELQREKEYYMKRARALAMPGVDG